MKRVRTLRSKHISSFFHTKAEQKAVPLSGTGLETNEEATTIWLLSAPAVNGFLVLL